MISCRSTPRRDAALAVRWLWWLVAMVAIAVALWVGAERLSRRHAVARLGELPNLKGRPAALVEHLRAADRSARKDPNDATAVGALATAYHADGFYEQAHQCYGAAHDLDGSDWKWLYYQSLTDEYLGNTQAVVEDLQHVLAVRDDLAVAWYRLGEAHFKLQRYEKADAAYEAARANDRIDSTVQTNSMELASQRFPIRDYASLGLARVAMIREQVHEARRILKQVIERSPRFGPVHSMLGRVFDQLGEDAKAQAHRTLADSLPRYLPPADPMLDTLINASHNSQVLRKYVQIAQANENLARARYLVRRAMQLDPQGDDDAEKLGLILVDLDMNREALPYLRRHLKTKEQQPRFATMHKFAVCLMRSGSIGEAKAFLRRSIETHPHVKAFHNDLGALHASVDRHREAMGHYRKALRVDPEFDEAHNNLGVTLAALGKAQEAIDHYRRALQITPEYAEAHYNLALALQHRGDLGEAITHYRQAVKINPKHLSALINLGAVLEAQGEVKEAIECYSQVLAIKPDHAVAHNNLGAALFAEGNLGEATVHYRRTLEIRPDFAAAHYNLGEVRQVMGDIAEALQQYDEAIRLMPGSPLPLNAVAWLLATYPDANVREPNKAIRIAETAVELSERQHPVALDTLAASHAAAGQFEQAIAIAQEAIALTDASDRPELAKQIRERIKLYRQGNPHREPLLESGGIRPHESK